MQSDSAIDEIVGFINGCGRINRMDLVNKISGYYNIKRLGEGHYSAVFSHPYSHDKVIKVGFGGHGPEADYREDGWIQFALYVLNNPSEIFQRIYAVRCQAKYYVAVLDRLTPGGERYEIDALKEHPDFNKMAGVLGIPDDLRCGNCMMHGNRVVMTDPYSWTRTLKWDHVKKYTDKLGYVRLTVQEQTYEPRPVLADAREETILRLKAENRMLRDKPKSHHRAQSARIPRPLLPQSRPRWIRSPFLHADFAGIELAAIAQMQHGARARVHDAFFFPEAAVRFKRADIERLRPDLIIADSIREEPRMGAKRRRELEHGDVVRVKMEREVRKNRLAGLVEANRRKRQELGRTSPKVRF